MIFLLNPTTKIPEQFCGNKQPRLKNCWIKKKMQVAFKELLNKIQAFYPKSTMSAEPLLGRKVCSRLRGPAGVGWTASSDQAAVLCL